MARQLTVGALAKRTGVSVRTLHHYEAIGLLAPAARTAAGYRLYGAAEISRLHQIQSLRALGFGLARIQETLDRPDVSPSRIIELHLAGLRAHVEEQRRLIDRLAGVAAALRLSGDVSIDDVLRTIEEITRVERYYTPEQLTELAERGRQLGEDGMRQAEQDWQTLMDEVRAEMAAGTDPADPRVRALAARWRGLVEAFTGGNPEIARSLNAVWRDETTIQGMNTADVRALGDYLAKADKD